MASESCLEAFGLALTCEKPVDRQRLSDRMG
jgi:hypothetical protein